MTTAIPSDAGVVPERPDRLILVYDGDSGVRAMLMDVLKKTVGREDCALCEITYGPLGKRRDWRACEQRLGVVVDELHRDRLPGTWGVTRSQIPCVLARVDQETPFVLVTRDEIAACRGSIRRLEERIAQALKREPRLRSQNPSERRST
jgi:hypothetical protein